MRFAKRRLLWPLFGVVLALVLIAGLGLLAFNLIIVRSARSSIAEKMANVPPAPVAIILGAGVRPDGTPSPMLTDRLETGIRLYKSGKVGRLLLTGQHSTKTYDEVNTMLRYVLARGVPEQYVFTDHAGFNTYDSMYRARDVFKVTTAIVVTQGFHLARAVYTARSLGIDASGVSADIQHYPTVWKNVAREWLARTKAYVDLHLLKPKPKFLGPEIPITGDGRASRG
jgi:SanA protein